MLDVWVGESNGRLNATTLMGDLGLLTVEVRGRFRLAWACPSLIAVATISSLVTLSLFS